MAGLASSLSGKWLGLGILVGLLMVSGMFFTWVEEQRGGELASASAVGLVILYLIFNAGYVILVEKPCGPSSLWSLVRYPTTQLCSWAYLPTETETPITPKILVTEPTIVDWGCSLLVGPARDQCCIRSPNASGCDPFRDLRIPAPAVTVPSEYSSCLMADGIGKDLCCSAYPNAIGCVTLNVGCLQEKGKAKTACCKLRPSAIGCSK